MLALDLFNTKYERDLAEGAVDNLEARRIDTLNDRMQELLARTKESQYKNNPTALAALKKQFQQVKDERDSYYKVREGGIPGNVPPEQIPGKEDLLKGKGRSYYEGAEDYAGIYSPEAIALGKRFCEHYNITDDGDVQLAVEIIDSYLDEFKATDTPVDLKKIRSGVADAFRQVYRGMGPGPTFRKKFQEETQLTIEQSPRALGVAMRPAKDIQAANEPQAQAVAEHGGGIGPRQHWQDLMPEQLNSDDWYDEEDQETDLRSGDYVRDTMDGEYGEIFRMQGDPYERRVRILDRDGKGWYIEPSRLIRVDPTDPDVQRYFGKKRVRDMDEADATDQVKRVFKDKAGQPVGEIGIDPESSPGNSEWYVYHYGTGYSVVGFDNAAEAKRELMYVHKHPEAVEGHESTFNEGGIPGSVPTEKIPGKEDLLKGRGRSYYEDQKKNAEVTDPAQDRLLTRARREHPKARTDAEALAMRILDKETDDVTRLDRVNDREDRMIDKLSALEKSLQQQIDQLKGAQDLDEGRMGEIDAMRQDLERMNERQFYTAYGISKAAFQQKYRTLLKPALDEGSQQLHQGDPIVVTAPNEFEGKTGEIAEFSPSGKFVVVNLYNHGEHSMHLSDIEYNQYAADQAEEDDWYDDADEFGKPGSEFFPEGFQDFNKVEPYAVCLAGKPVKKFDYYEEARKFHDNWKQKLYREGNKAKADTITLMPLNLDEGARGDAIKQGYQAAVKGLTKQQNPYYKSVNGQTPPEAYDWEAGWEDARDAGKIPQGVAEGEGIDPKIQFLQPTIQFAEKMGYKATLNPQGRVVAKLVNKQLGHIVHIGLMQPSGKGFEVSMADNLDKQTNAWSAKELAQDFKGWYAQAVKDQDFNNGYNVKPQLEQQGVAEEQKPADPNEFRPVGPITIVPPKKLKSGETYQDRNKYWQSQGQAPIYKTNEAAPRHFGPKGAGTELARQIRGSVCKTPQPYNTQKASDLSTDELNALAGPRYPKRPKVQVKKNQGKGTPVPAKKFAQGVLKDLKKVNVNEVKADPAGSWVVYGGSKVVKFKTHSGAKAYAEKSGGKVASSEFYADKIQKQGVAEGDELTHAGQDVMVWTGPPTNNPPTDDKKYWVRGQLDSTEMHGGSMRANVMTAKGMYNPELSRVFNADMSEAYTPSPAKPFRNPPGFNKQGTGVGNKLAQQTRAELAKKKQPVKEFAPSNGDNSDNFDPEMAAMAKKEGVVKGYSLVDHATVEQALEIPHCQWGDMYDGQYKQYFVKGFINGRKAKLEQARKDGVALTLQKDGRLARVQQGVAEDTDSWFRVTVKTPNGKNRNIQVPANSHGTAKRKALAYCAKNNIAGAEFVSAMRMPTLDEQGVAEAETDYSKRRQREKDVDAGKPVAKQREPRMTDYQKRRAEQKRQEALGEDQDTSGVEQAIIRRIMVAHTDLLMKFGPDKVMQAAEEVAYNVGDVDEIGTSDVSAYVAQVKQILGAV